MTDTSTTAGVTRAAAGSGAADVVVGVVSFNSVRTVRHVVETAAAAVTSFYPGAAAVIVLADAGSRDGTVAAARAAAAAGVPVVVSDPGAWSPAGAGPAVPGRGDGLRAVLEAAGAADAAGCAVVDASVAAITPEWVRRLLEPVLRQGTDLVAPLYARHTYDGMLTSFLVYPLTRALYGRRLRQPVGGHFGFSGALVRRLLDAGGWGGAAGRYRRDLWLTTRALADGVRVAQACLGSGRRGPRDASGELGSAFVDVVGTAFGLMEDYRPAWRAVVETAEVPCIGDPSPVGTEPVSVNVDRMLSTFRQGVADLMPLWRRMLAAEACAALEALAGAAPADFHFPPPLWAQIVFDAAAAHHARVLPRAQLLRALIPLYLGRAAAFVVGTAASDPREAEAQVEAGCAAFEAAKPYLLERWDARRA